MVSWVQLLAFLPVAAVVVAVPGPSVLFTVGRALSVGRADALATVVGNGMGLAVQAGLVAVGLGTVLASVSWSLTLMKVLGGLYLVWLGVAAIRNRAATRSAGTQPGSGTPPPLRRALRTGIVLGLGNPKTLVFLSALLPQFVSPSGPAVGQMLVLGLTFAALAVTGDSVWALAAARARRWLGSSPRGLERLAAGGGALLVGLGAYTVATGSRTR
jgi:threonine/homoserine/homoserine lactone efflux protein